MLQKFEEEFEDGKILHPTLSHAETTPSSPCALSPSRGHTKAWKSLTHTQGAASKPMSFSP